MDSLTKATQAIDNMFLSPCLVSALKEDTELVADICHDLADRFAEHETVGEDITKEQWESRESKYDDMFWELLTFFSRKFHG